MREVFEIVITVDRPYLCETLKKGQVVTVIDRGGSLAGKKAYTFITDTGYRKIRRQDCKKQHKTPTVGGKLI